MSVPFADAMRTPYESCPLCAGELRVLRDQDWSWREDFRQPLLPVIRWMVCGECGHQCTWGPLTAEGMQLVFSHTQAGQTPAGLRSSQVEAERYTWGKVVDAVARFQPDGRWLDVGAGSGMLLGLARECGYEVTGSDLRESTAEALRARGFNTINGDLANLRSEWPDTFDVISMCDVLEHVPFPMPALMGVWGALKPGGILFLSSPNRASLAWEVLDEENVNPYWAEIEHCHNFSYPRLREVLSGIGFEPLGCSVSNRYRVGMDVLARRPSAARRGSRSSRPPVATPAD